MFSDKKVDWLRIAFEMYRGRGKLNAVRRDDLKKLLRALPIYPKYNYYSGWRESSQKRQGSRS